MRESIAAFEKAKLADPLYPIPSVYLGCSLAMTGRFDQAVVEARRALDLDPSNEAIRNLYSSILSVSGRHAEALAIVRRAIPETKNIRHLGFDAWILGANGSPEEATTILRHEESLPEATWRRYSALTVLNLAVGDTARALDALDAASKGGGDLFLAMGISAPRFDPLRARPRFADAMRRFNLDLSRVSAPDGGRSR